MTYPQWKAQRASRIQRFAFAVIVGILAFCAAMPALAQDVAAQVPANLVSRALVAVLHHDWWTLAGLAAATVLATMLTHKAGIAKAIPWFGTDAGGTVWTFLFAVLTAVAASVSTGAHPSLVTVKAALVVGGAAVGGYTAVRKILGPSGVGRWIPGLDKIADWFGPKQIAGQPMT